MRKLPSRPCCSPRRRRRPAAPHIPIVSEENLEVPFETRKVGPSTLRLRRCPCARPGWRNAGSARLPVFRRCRAHSTSFTSARRVRCPSRLWVEQQLLACALSSLHTHAAAAASTYTIATTAHHHHAPKHTHIGAG
jgi:hypothetical protein